MYGTDIVALLITFLTILIAVVQYIDVKYNQKIHEIKTNVEKTNPPIVSHAAFYGENHSSQTGAKIIRSHEKLRNWDPHFNPYERIIDRYVNVRNVVIVTSVIFLFFSIIFILDFELSDEIIVFANIKKAITARSILRVLVLNVQIFSLLIATKIFIKKKELSRIQKEYEKYKELKYTFDQINTLSINFSKIDTHKN